MSAEREHITSGWHTPPARPGRASAWAVSAAGIVLRPPLALKFRKGATLGGASWSDDQLGRPECIGPYASNKAEALTVQALLVGASAVGTPFRVAGVCWARGYRVAAAFHSGGSPPARR